AGAGGVLDRRVRAQPLGPDAVVVPDGGEVQGSGRQGPQGRRHVPEEEQVHQGRRRVVPRLRVVRDAGPEQWVRLRTPQVRYLTRKTRRADFIGRQETLEADLRAIFARLELPWEPLQSVNVDRSRPDYRELYTDPMRQRVEDLFAKDIAAFDYT